MLTDTETAANRSRASISRYPEMAAAGLWTTAADLAAVVVGLADSYAGKTQALLAGATIIDMLRQQQPSEPYGLGVRLDQGADGLWFGHGGDSQGFLSESIGSTVGHGLVVMTNSDAGGGAKNLVNAVKARAAALYGWRDEPLRFDQRDSDLDLAVVPSGRSYRGRPGNLDTAKRGRRASPQSPRPT